MSSETCGKKAVRGRFAPSPTGDLHVGNARTALLAWWHARRHGGAFVLRMEDLDPQRSKAEAARGILADLKWLGIDWDEGPDVGGPYAPYVQSRRSERYREALAALQQSDRIYPCRCSRAEVRAAASAPHGRESKTPRYPGTCRPKTPGEWESIARTPMTLGPFGDRRPSWRFVAPAGAITFTDGVAGEVRTDLAASVGDFIVRRSDGVAAYHLAAAVDDADQEITHVVRGDDLLDTTACQIALLNALGLPVPTYLHVPLVVDSSGARLAKRKGDLTLASLRAKGVSPQLIVGVLAWTCEILPEPVEASPRELIDEFSLAHLKSGPVVLTPDLFFRGT